MVPSKIGRSLTTTILYPADVAAGSVAVSDALPTRADAPFPLILFSHGIDATVSFFEPLLTSWAAAGYVVVAPTFPLTNSNAVGGPQSADYVNQPGDIRYVLDQVLALNATGTSWLSGLVATNEIVAVGHSLGAVTTLGLTDNSCCLDRRIKAAVLISVEQLPFPGGQYVAGLSIPMLFIHGDDDMTYSYAAGRAAFEDTGSTPRFLLTLRGGPHTPFSAPYVQVVSRTVLDFVGGYLKSRPDPVARLQDDAMASGVATLEVG